MKKLLSSLFLLLAVFTLASCTSTGGGGNTPEKDDRITVTFWHAMGDFNQKIIQEMIDSFEAKYPNVHVVQQKQGGYADLLDKVKKNIQPGTGPAIAQTYPDHVSTYLSAKGAVVDLNNYIWDEELGFDANGITSDTFVQAFYKEGTSYDKEGSMYSLPFNKSTEVIFYNKTFFNTHDWFVGLLGLNQDEVYSKYVAAGSKENVYNPDFVWHPTWQQLEKVGAAFQDTKEYKAIIDKKEQAVGFSYDSQANLFITLTQQFAALDKDAKFGEKGEKAYTAFNDQGIGQFTFLEDPSVNPYARQAIEYYKAQYDAKNFGTSGTLGVKYSSDAFKAGNCIVTIGSSAGAKYNYPGDPKDTFEVGVGTYPQLEGTAPEKYQVIQQGTNITLFTQKDKEVEKYAWLFMLHMVSQENALKWSTKTSYFPIRTDVYESEAYQDFVTGKKEVDGQVIYEPSLGSAAAKVGWTQQSWFYTNVAFNGTDVARAEIEKLVEAVLLGTKDVVNKAFADAKDHLKNYIVK